VLLDSACNYCGFNSLTVCFILFFFLQVRDAVINLEASYCDSNVGEFTVFHPNCSTEVQ